jgi:hypothetical protein
MPKPWRAWRFDLVEVGMIVAIVGLVAYIAPRPAPPPDESDELERVYGSARNSENEEEWIIRDFFKDRRGGVFVDVGAATTSPRATRTISNTISDGPESPSNLSVTLRLTGPGIGQEPDSVRSLYPTCRTTG